MYQYSRGQRNATRDSKAAPHLYFTVHGRITHPGGPEGLSLGTIRPNFPSSPKCNNSHLILRISSVLINQFSQSWAFWKALHELRTLSSNRTLPRSHIQRQGASNTPHRWIYEEILSSPAISRSFIVNIPNVLLEFLFMLPTRSKHAKVTQHVRRGENPRSRSVTRKEIRLLP